MGTSLLYRFQPTQASRPLFLFLELCFYLNVNEIQPVALPKKIIEGVTGCLIVRPTLSDPEFSGLCSDIAH